MSSVGDPTSYKIGAPVYVGGPNAYVVRDANGLYAISAVCTHAGCTVDPYGAQLYCPCHGSQFDFAGAVRAGPASSPLPHLAMCLMSDGTIGVDNTTEVPASDRLVS